MLVDVEVGSTVIPVGKLAGTINKSFVCAFVREIVADWSCPSSVILIASVAIDTGVSPSVNTSAWFGLVSIVSGLVKIGSKLPSKVKF